MITTIYNKKGKIYIVAKKNDKSVFINYNTNKKCYFSEELNLAFVIDINDMTAKGLINDIRFKSELRKNNKGHIYFTINENISLPKEEEEKINYLISHLPPDSNQEQKNTENTDKDISQSDDLPF